MGSPRVGSNPTGVVLQSGHTRLCVCRARASSDAPATKRRPPSRRALLFRPVPDVDMGLAGVKRNSAERSDDPPATKARPSQPTPPTGSRVGGDVSPTLPSRPVFQPSGPKFFRMDTPPDDEYDPEATSSGPPPLPITDDGPSASMPAPKPADKPEFQPSQPAATADEESDADDGEDDTVPYSTGSDRTVPYESDQSLISDLYVDELSWTFLTQEQKLCSNTASFSVPRYITGLPVDVLQPVDVLHTHSPGDLAWLTSHQYHALKANVRRQKKRAYGDLSAEYSGQPAQKNLQASTVPSSFRGFAVARLAQSVERKALNLVVVGSSPTVGVSSQKRGRVGNALELCFVGEKARSHQRVNDEARPAAYAW